MVDRPARLIIRIPQSLGPSSTYATAHRRHPQEWSRITPAFARSGREQAHLAGPLLHKDGNLSAMTTGANGKFQSNLFRSTRNK